MSGRRIVTWALFIAAALALGYSLALHRFRYGRPEIPAALQQVLWPEPRAIAPFKLTDQYGGAFDLSRLRDRWSFVFFGYTSCPDVCPTTLGAMKLITARLAQKQPYREIQFVFVSVDPLRDTPEQLRRYVAYFDVDFIGVTGSPDEIANLARQFNVMYERAAAQKGGGYIIQHTASVMLVDPQARLYAAFSRPHDTKAVVTEFRAIQQLYEEQKR